MREVWKWGIASPRSLMDDPVLGRRASLAGAFVMHVAGQHALVAFAADSEMPAIFEDAEACIFNFGFIIKLLRIIIIAYLNYELKHRLLGTTPKNKRESTQHLAIELHS